MLTKLRALRLAAGLSQKEVAERLGVSRQWYSLIDSGRLRPTEEMAAKIADIFGISADEILQPVKIRKIGG